MKCIIAVTAAVSAVVAYGDLGPDLQRILRQTYDSAALTPDLRRACELRAINKKS